MREMAAADDIFQYPVSPSPQLEQVIADIDPTIRPMGNFTPSASDRKFGVVSKRRFRNANGQDFFVLQDRDGQVWLDISNFVSGHRGSDVYAAVANYAHNTGRVFIGDPAGLSDVALRRRTDAMLSTALKFGTTRHIEPHPRQIAGDAKLGVPPLKWTPGDDLGNVQSLIETSTANLNAALPEVQNARYDFQARAFRTSKGEPLTDAKLRDWRNSHPRIGEAGAGRATLKRGILLNTLLRAESGQRPGLLEFALRLPRHLVEQGGLKGTLYRIPVNQYRFAISRAQAAQVSAEIQTMAEQILGHTLTRVDIYPTSRDWQTVFPEFQDADYDPNDRVISIALQASQDPRALLRHEAIHVLRHAGSSILNRLPLGPCAGPRTAASSPCGNVSGGEHPQEPKPAGRDRNSVDRAGSRI